MTNLELMRRIGGMSQADLALKLAYTQPRISQLENGKTTVDQVSPELREALEQLFDRDIEWLLSPADTGERRWKRGINLLQRNNG